MKQMRFRVRTLFDRDYITKKEWKEMKTLPIFVTDKAKSWEKDWEINHKKWKDIYHVTSLEAKKKAPTAVEQFCGVVKSYPKVLSDIKRKNPKAVIYSSDPTEEKEAGWAYREKVFVRPKLEEKKEKKAEVEKWIQANVEPSERAEARKFLLERTVFPKEDYPLQSERKRRRGVAEHIFHELEHVSQERRLGRKEMERQAEKYPYEKIPFEIQAQRSAERQLTHFRLDTDRDGVLDFRDCRPFNPFLQDTDFIPAQVSGYEKSRKLVRMSPKEYLELALPKSHDYSRFDANAYDQESLKNLRYRMEEELEIDPPSFTVDMESGAIINHSGRHRAYIAYELGIKQIPVIVYFKHAGMYIEKFGGIMRPPEKVEMKSELEGLSYKRRR